jgi:hypothetical protein
MHAPLNAHPTDVIRLLLIDRPLGEFDLKAEVQDSGSLCARGIEGEETGGVSPLFLSK